MVSRRAFLAMAAAATVSPWCASAEDVHPIAARLSRELAAAADCGERAAITGTLSRLNRLALPSSGRSIVVNIAGRFLAAYRDGEPELESRVVVGRDGWRTPDLSTTVGSVTLNPTWTVPETILRDEGWRREIASDPEWAVRNGFDVVIGGRRLAPGPVARSDLSKATLVQRPGAENALGRVKIAMRNAGSIYLHSTNAVEGFDDADRTDSHGCVRVEQAVELAAWILGVQSDALASELDADVRAVRHGPEPVAVVFGYFTAWPDAADKVVFYPDVYRRDASRCDQEDSYR
jgi:murein L,D-transpeptidase YcbB/YkuD